MSAADWNAQIRSKRIQYAVWGKRFVGEAGVEIALKSGKLGIEPGGWIEIEKTQKRNLRKPTGMYMGKLFVEPKSPTTKPASIREIPGLYAEKIATTRPATKPATRPTTKPASGN
jgi:hypothetical protein